MLKQFGDTVTEHALLEALNNAKLITQCITKYRAKGYRVHKRNKQTAVQLYGGRTVTVRTVYMLPAGKKTKCRTQC